MGTHTGNGEQLGSLGVSAPASVTGGSGVCPGSAGVTDRGPNAAACTRMGQSPAVHAPCDPLARTRCPRCTATTGRRSSEPKGKSLFYLCEGLCALQVSRKTTATHQLSEWLCRTASQPAQQKGARRGCARGCMCISTAWKEVRNRRETYHNSGPSKREETQSRN